MTMTKLTLFQKGQQIRLSQSKLCYEVGTTTLATIRPRFLLTFVRQIGDWYHFKVSYNGEYEPLTAKNKSIVRISEISFGSLKYARIKNPTP